MANMFPIMVWCHMSRIKSDFPIESAYSVRHPEDVLSSSAV